MIKRFSLPLSLGHVARMLAVAAWLLAAGDVWADDDGFVFILNKDHTDGWRQLGEGEVKLHEGGGITLIPGKRGKSGVYLYGSRTFSDFILKLDFRVDNAAAKSGVYLRFPDPGDDYIVPGDTGYKININASDTGGIAVPRHETPPTRIIPSPLGEWTECEVTVVGQHYTVKINGELVNDFTGDRALTGYIGLQILKGTAPIRYRRIKIKELTAGAVAAALATPAAPATPRLAQRPATPAAVTAQTASPTPKPAPKPPVASALPAPTIPPRAAPAVASIPRPAGRELDSAELVKTYRGSLVFVTSDDGSAGSGFIAKNGHGNVVFTNAHVAAGVRDATYRTLNGAEIKAGRASCAVGRDVVELEAPDAEKPMEIMKGVDEKATIGDQIVVLGNSEGAGVINTIHGRIVGIGPDLVEVDAPFQPGNSGSPIIHMKTGQVIGLATYAIVRDNDTLTGVASAAPKVRRFGYRLDTITKWQPIEWNTFSAQAKELEGIEKRTEDLAGFLGDLAQMEPIGTHNNPAIRNRIQVWSDAQSQARTVRDKDNADASLVDFLSEACQGDVKATQPHMTYDYFRRSLNDLQKAREELSAAFEEVIKKLRHAPPHP